MNNPESKTLLVAIGSPHGDDQAAWEVADLVAARPTETISIRKASVPINIIDWLEGIEELHIVDACEGGGQTGELLRCEWLPNANNIRPVLERTTTETPEVFTQSNLPPRIPSQAQSSPGHPFNLRTSGSHDFDVLSVLELSRTLNRLPERVIIYGIVGEKFEPSDDVSSGIRNRLTDIADAVSMFHEAL